VGQASPTCSSSAAAAASARCKTEAGTCHPTAAVGLHAQARRPNWRNRVRATARRPPKSIGRELARRRGDTDGTVPHAERNDHYHYRPLRRLRALSGPWCGYRDPASAFHDRTHWLAFLFADPYRVTRGGGGGKAELRDRPDPSDSGAGHNAVAAQRDGAFLRRSLRRRSRSDRVSDSSGLSRHAGPPRELAALMPSASACPRARAGAAAPDGASAGEAGCRHDGEHDSAPICSMAGFPGRYRPARDLTALPMHDETATRGRADGSVSRDVRTPGEREASDDH